MGKPPPGVPPGDEAHEGAMRILGVISVLSDNLRLGNALATRRKLLSGEAGDPNHQAPLKMPPKRCFSFRIVSTKIPKKQTCRIFPLHILSARSLPLLDPQIRNVERWYMHVVRTILMPQRSMSFRTRQRKVVQFKLVPLVTIYLVQHVLEHLDEHLELFQVERWIDCLRYEMGHHLSSHEVDAETVFFIAEHQTINIYNNIKYNIMKYDNTHNTY